MSASPEIRAALGPPESALAVARNLLNGQTDLSQDTPLHTLVGAAVAVCLFDKHSSWCALRKLIVPQSTRGHRQDAMLKADAALEDVYNQLCTTAEIKTGTDSRKRIQAKIFGGGEPNAVPVGISEGAQNVSFVRSWLGARQIPVTAESIGGRRMRQVVIIPPRRIVYCRSKAMSEAFLAEEKSWLLAERETSNKVELF